MQPTHINLYPPHLWPQQETNAYHLLAAFFDHISIDQYHFVTGQFTNAACMHGYVQQTPGTLLTWYEKTQLLFYAANLVHLNASGTDLDLGVDISALPWDRQPHHLGEHEVKDPYIAIEEVFEFLPYDKWLLELHAWLHAAFNENSILEEAGKPHEVITLLHKLADAMWVLWVHKSRSVPA